MLREREPFFYVCDMDLTYFSPREFGEWWSKMAPDLLLKLDGFRHEWDGPVIISPVDGALGRRGGASGSMHNVDKWDLVRAVDVFPGFLVSGRIAFIHNQDQRRRAYSVARAIGFTGIGIYTDTRPGNMLHLDNRDGHLATWSRVAGKYLGIDEVL